MKKILLVLGLSVFLSFGAFAPLSQQPVSALSTGAAKSQACKGITATGGSCSGGTTEVNKIIGYVVKFISILAGIFAVVMIIVAGMRFIASNGDSNKVSAAKQSLIYAIVGVAIVALAQILVHTVLDNLG